MACVSVSYCVLRVSYSLKRFLETVVSFAKFSFFSNNSVSSSSIFICRLEYFFSKSLKLRKSEMRQKHSCSREKLPVYEKMWAKIQSVLGERENGGRHNKYLNRARSTNISRKDAPISPACVLNNNVHLLFSFCESSILRFCSDSSCFCFHLAAFEDHLVDTKLS